MAHHSSLELNRRLQNHAFESWKLGGDFVASRESAQLPGQVFLGAGEALDFMHTRASVLRNHLLQSQLRNFVVTAGQDISLVINEVTATIETTHIVPVAGKCLPVSVWWKCLDQIWF